MRFYATQFPLVEHCADVMDGYTVRIEFRHASWFADAQRSARTLAFERERGLLNVIVDEPQGAANSIPAVWEVTNEDLALLRLHGRNHATWNITESVASSQRFNYDDNDDELADLATQIYEISQAAAQTHALILLEQALRSRR